MTRETMSALKPEIQPPPDQLSPLARFGKVLICTDGSNFSAGALRVGLAMAKKAGAHVTALAMVRTNLEYEAVAPYLLDQRIFEARVAVQDIAAQAAALGVSCTPNVVYGEDPALSIIDQANALNVDVIVMGRRGKRGLAKMMVGAATEKVAGQARCSVLVVPQTAEMWGSRVLLATDGSRGSDAAAVTAARIAHCCEVPLSVVSVLKPSHSEERRQEGHSAVDRTTSLLKQEGHDVSGQAIEGHEIDQAILDAAQATNSDLIVVGSQGRSTLHSALFGTVSQRVLGKATCPVLVAKG
jgi:nucleotide-binding universal stress UspA family protein